MGRLPKWAGTSTLVTTNLHLAGGAPSRLGAADRRTEPPC